MKESQIQKAILEWLAAKHILAFRMNTGAMAAEYKGKQRFMRFGVAGMADILAFQDGIRGIVPTWIEVKTATGRQSEMQKSFEAQVREHGHYYFVARSIEDVMEWL